ncbi:Mitochondrial fission factor [Aphelenchoides besseyi]|nr:Mitochondrial fission factor [Aphelenchoides besseyi]KAI6209237.1 Mitochondrial fission factor [Aphelenchoides besseyi]
MEQMTIPDHVYIDGRRRTISSPYARTTNRNQRLSFTEMQVPDKITVGENGQLIAHPSQPNDVLRDRIVPPKNEPVSLVPNTLTANQFPSDGLPANIQQNRQDASLQNAESTNNLNSSLAVETDPIRELKNVRRQLGRLATRVLELEDENQRRSTREYGLWSFLAGGVILLAFLFGRR